LRVIHMNIFFGSAFSSKETQNYHTLVKQVEAQYSTEPTMDVDINNYDAGSISNDGAVLGRAAVDGIYLTLLGSVCEPVPEWTSTLSPIEHPNKVAEHLVSLYKKDKQKFLTGIQGQYALCLFDSHTQTLCLSVDHAELRSIYYTTAGDEVLFSTNQYALVRSLRQNLKSDRSYEDFFLIYGFLPGQRTFFENIKTVKPGELFIWEGGALNFKTYAIEKINPWGNSFAKTDWESLDQDGAIDVVYDAFMSALKEQLTESKRVGVLLGGFDSALVAAALHRLGKEVETFSFSYEDERYNQGHIDTLQDFLGHKHHWIKITENDIREGLKTYPNYFNRPTNWPNYVIQTQVVCKKIREQGLTHCYSGDGCDGVFLGYPIVHVRAKLFSAPIKLPKFILSMILWFAKFPLWEKLFGHVFAVILNVFRSFARPWPQRGHLTLRIFDEISLKRLRADKAPDQAKPLDQILEKLSKGLETLTPARLAYLGKGAISPNKVKISGSSDSAGISIHAPYMHAGMAKFALSIPDSLCRPDGESEAKVTGKYILMKMAEKKGLLPYDCVYQKKLAAVDAPIDDWYEGPLKEDLLSLLKDLPFKANTKYLASLTQQRKIEKLYKKHIAPDQICSSHTVSLLATYAAFAKALKD